MQPRANSDKICIPGLRKRFRSVPEYCPDRKSTRLNSSHSQISHAVFCLKKKSDFVKSRPPDAEWMPIYQAILLAAVTRRRLHIVHVSTKDRLELGEQAHTQAIHLSAGTY